MNSSGLQRFLRFVAGLAVALLALSRGGAQSISAPADGYKIVVARGASVAVGIFLTDAVVTSCQSSAEAIATAASMESEVTVSGVANGTATVTYTITGGASRTFEVTVVDPLVVLPSAVIPNDIVVGRHTTYMLQTTPSGGVISAASTSSSTDVATVEDIDSTNIRVGGVSLGGAEITLTVLLKGATFTHTFPVTVRPPYVTNLTEGSEQSVTVGENLRLKVYTNPVGGEIKAVAISAPTVAAASFSGHSLLLTGLSVGEAIVTYETEIDGYTATNTVALHVAASVAPNIQSIDFAAPTAARVGRVLELGATSNAAPPYLLEYAALAGTGIFRRGSYTPTAIGTHILRAYNNGDSSYGPAYRDITFAVGAGDPVSPTIVWNPAPLAYGRPLDSAQLGAFAVDNFGHLVPGQFGYSPAAGTVLDLGEDQPIHAAFTPDDPVAFAVAEADNTVDVRLVGAGTRGVAFGSDVAVGDINESANLEVTGSVAVRGDLAVAGSVTGSSTGLSLAAGGTDQNVTITPSGGGSTVLNGNVGIGTYNPSAKLDVAGDAKVQGSLSVSGAFTSDHLSSMDLTLTTGLLTGGASGLTLNPGAVDQNVVLQTIGSGYTLIKGDTTTATPNPALKIQSGGGEIVFGNVYPTTVGEIQANPPTLTFRSTITAGQPQWSGSTRFTYNASGFVISHDGNGAGGQGQGPKGLGLGTGGREADIFIDQLGSVGVGTSTPTAKLDVAGDAIIGGNLAITGTFSASNFQPATGTFTGGATGLTLSAGGADQNVTIAPSGSGATILNGNVGIGQTPAGARLALTQAIETNASNGLTIRRATDDSQLGQGFNFTADAWQIAASSGATGAYKPLTFWTSSNERVRIASDGKVGIGTSAPKQKLSVTGILNSDSQGDYYGAWLSGSSTAGQESLLGLGPWYNQAGYVKWTDNSRLSIYTYNPTRAVTLQEAGGNVGIGTTSPQKKLDVAGDANVSGNLTIGGMFTAAGFGGGVLTGGASGLTLDSGATDQSISFATTGNGGVVMQRSSGKAWQRLASSAAPAFLELSGASTQTNGAVANGFGAGIYLKAENNTVGNYAGIENVNQGGTTNARIDFVNLSHTAGNAAGAIDLLTGGAVGSLSRVARFDATTLTLDTGSLTGGAAGLRLNAGGPNQSLTLAPNGTGQLLVPLATATFQLAPVGDATVQASSSGGLDFKAAAGAVISFSPNAAEAARFGGSGNLLLGTTVDAGNGRVQLASHTGPSGGLGLGSDWSIYRISPTDLAFASSGTLRWTMHGNGLVGNGSSSLTVGPGTPAAPSFNFTGAANSGLYRGVSAADVGVSSNGVSVAQFNQSNLKLFQTTASTSPTSGALVVPGGAGIGGAINVGGNAAVAGLTSTGTLSVANNATVGGTLGVTGTTSTGALAVSSNATVGGALGVTGATTLSGPLVANSSATLNGPTTAASLNVANAAAFQGTSTFGGTMTFASGGDTMGQILWSDTPMPSTQLVAGSGRALLLGANGSAITGLAVTTTGNVGVGTTSPAARLHVLGATAELRIESSAAGDSGWLSFRDAAGQKGAVRFLSASAQLTFDAAGATHGFNFVNGDVGIGTTTPAARLDVAGDAKVTGALDVSAQAAVGSLDVSGNATIDGSLGIGTAPSAGHKLDVVGNVQISGGLSATGDGVFTGAVKVGSGTNQWTLDNSSGTLGFMRAGTAWLTVNAAGGANFAGNLSVGGSSGIAFSASGADFNGNRIQNLGYAAAAGDAASKAYVDGTNPVQWDGPQAYLKSSIDRFGLGTAVPAAPLHIAKALNDGEIARFTAPTTWSQRAYLRLGGGNDQRWWEFSAQDANGGNTENGLAFRVRNGTGTSQPQMYLAANGNVGIGTTQPGEYKLAVNGTIHTQEVVVDTEGWSDYVFDDNYRNAPLAEVEAQIKEYKHLPGVPSAQEVAEKGVNVGQMQAVLLAKVEELTLHLIEQEKRIKRLEDENAELRAAHH